MAKIGVIGNNEGKAILNQKKKGKGRHKKSVSPKNRRQTFFTDGKVRKDGRGKI